MLLQCSCIVLRLSGAVLRGCERTCERTRKCTRLSVSYTLWSLSIGDSDSDTMVTHW